MSNNLDFMAIFGGEGSLDLGSGGEDFDALFAEKEPVPIDPEREDGLIHYADIHSHNSMAAQFSDIDDADERANRLYLVMGRLNQYFPEVSARICNGGTFLSTPAMCWRGCPRRSLIGGLIEYSCWRIPSPFLPPKRTEDTQSLPRPRKNLRRGNKPWQG